MPSLPTFFTFLAGFALHAAMILSLRGWAVLPIEPAVASTFASAGLLIAVAAIWRDLARRDEVQRSLALSACAVSLAVTALASYSGILFDTPMAAAHSAWALALATWLLTFGWLEIRARW